MAGTHTDLWEHSYVEAGNLNLTRFTQIINDLAVDGWQLVSTHSTDRTLGLNSVTAFLRRPIVPLDAPADTAPGWHPDPAGRHEHRYWNGRAWTYRVADNGVEHRDPPTQLPPSDLIQ